MAGIRKFDTGKMGPCFLFNLHAVWLIFTCDRRARRGRFLGMHGIVVDNGAGEIPSAPELVKYVWERVTFKMNAFGPVDSREASTAIIRMLAQGTRSSRFWPLPDILSPE